MEASMAVSSRGAMTPYSSFRSKEITGMANSKTNLRQISLSSAFCDRSHMQYYPKTVKAYCGGKKEKLEKRKLKGLEALQDGSLSEKRRIKLLELVSKDLSALSTTFVQGGEAQKTLEEEVRGQILSESLQVLMAQLEQVKAERKQRKKEMKAQKKALKAQKKLQTKIEYGNNSSSSESSDSECEVINMTQIQEATVKNPPEIFDIALNNTDSNLLSREFAETANKLGISGLEDMEGVKRVSVCMGGKCKKSGSEQLLAAFEDSTKKSGMDCRIEAVGCKCMGKCRSAPNVKVQSENGREMHMAVEIGSVDGIVDRHFRLQPQQDDMVGGSLVPV